MSYIVIACTPFNSIVCISLLSCASSLYALAGPRIKFLYLVWVWRPSWSCDPDVANKLSFPLPKEAPHKIWQAVLEKKMFENVSTDGQTTDHEYPISSPMSLWLR